MNATQTIQASRIAQITGIKESEIVPYLEAKTFAKPTTAEQANAIINSKYSTPEQKAEAEEVKFLFSKQKINEVKNLEEAKKAYQNVRFFNRELVMLALEKLISKAKKHSDITIYARHQDSMPVDIRNEHDQKVRSALITLAIDLDTSINIWKSFPFFGTEEGAILITKTLEYFLQFKDINQNPSTNKELAYALYLKTPGDHPLTMSFFIFAVAFMNDKHELEVLYEYLNQQYYTAEKILRDASCEIDKINRHQSRDFFSEAQKMVRSKLDSICAEEISVETTEDELIAILSKSRNPNLEQAREKANHFLFGIWSRRLDNDMTFNDALESFQKSLSYGNRIYSQKFWRVVNGSSSSKAQVTRILNSVRNTDYYTDALRTWLIYEPDFEELFAEYKQNSSNLILTALFKQADTFEKASQVLDYCRHGIKQHHQQAALHLTTVITNVDEGIQSIQKIQGCSMDDVRKSVLKATLKFVNIPLELKFITTCLETNYNIRDEEKRLIIEKALELLNETQPADPVTSPTT